MPVLGSEIKMYRSSLVGDVAASNGGVMSANEVVTSVNNNIFPDVPQSERAAGSVKWRKVFFRDTNSGNLPLLNPRVYMDNYTQGDDAVYFADGTQSDLQSGLPGTPKLYGCAKLDSSLSAGATSLNVLIEDSTNQYFKDGDVIRITNKADVSSAGQEEFVTISGAPTIAGAVVTIHTATPVANAYTAATTRVSNVLSIADLKPAVSGVNVTTAGSGTFDSANIGMSNLGTEYDVWSITFTSSTAYTVSGARIGAVGAGGTLSDFSPINPANGLPYFTLASALFGGAWLTGDTVAFTTAPAAHGLWCKRVVPTGATAISGNRFIIAIDGETA